MAQSLRRITRVMVPLLGLAPWMACSSDESGGGTGGTPSTGGIASGTGGATGGTVSSTGGVAPSTGGTVSSFGGSVATGGAKATGGTVSTGGKSGDGTGTTGGASTTGGSKATGGDSSTGSPGNGGSSTGGASTGTGGGSGGGMMTSAGCGKAPTLKSGRASIDVSGSEREYILSLPDNYDENKPYRLIFGWHPWGGSAEQVSGGGYYGLKAKSENSAIFVAPEGLQFQGMGKGWGNQNGADIDFLEAMLAEFRGGLCIDENRIFSTGFSFGGMFSFASGCSPNGMMRAIAPMAGNSMVSGCESSDRSVAVMGFHGRQDNVVQIDGGRRGRDIFVERNGCSESSKALSPSWCDGAGAAACECVTYDGCKEGYPVIWCEFDGGHTPAPNSGSTIWNFFAQF